MHKNKVTCAQGLTFKMLPLKSLPPMLSDLIESAQPCPICGHARGIVSYDSVSAGPDWECNATLKCSACGRATTMRVRSADQSKGQKQ